MMTRLNATTALVLALCASATPAMGQDILQAALRDDTAAVRELIDADPAPIHLANEDGRTLLHAAAATSRGMSKQTAESARS